MSTKQIFTNFSLKNKKYAILSIFAISFFVIAIVGVTSFNIGKKQSLQSKSPIPIIDISKISANNSGQQILGQQTYSWTGEITDKQKNILTFVEVQKNANGDAVTITITANVNDDTNIVKWDLTNPPENYSEENNKSKIEYDDLAVGNKIIVKSNNNLDQNNEITALDISLLITP